jgi:hypothetical protein
VSEEKKNTVLRIYKYFESERKHGHPFYALDKIAERTTHALGVRRSFLYSILKESSKCKDPLRGVSLKRYSLDSFDKDLIRRVVMQLFSKNEFVSLKRIKNHLLQKTTR